MYGSSVAKSYRENFRFHDYMRLTADARKQAEIRSVIQVQEGKN